MANHQISPKHLLPIGQETVLGRIVKQARQFGRPVIRANADNASYFQDLLKDTYTQILVDAEQTGPPGPLFRTLANARQTTFACAGDFWAAFSRPDFYSFHKSSGFPVTVLAGPSVVTEFGARFSVGAEGEVQSWERVTRTITTDLINIGAYIVDPDSQVLAYVNSTSRHNEDQFFDAMIALGFMNEYVLPTKAYNVNDPCFYDALRGACYT